MKEPESPYSLLRIRPRFAYDRRLYGSYALNCAESFLARRGRCRPLVESVADYAANPALWRMVLLGIIHRCLESLV
jgi:hypothetical protein